MEQVNASTKSSPKRLLIYSSEPARTGIIGELKWNGEFWEVNGIGLSVITDLIDNGMPYGGKIYGRADYELYLPLVNSRYSTICFQQAN